MPEVLLITSYSKFQSTLPVKGATANLHIIRHISKGRNVHFAKTCKAPMALLKKSNIKRAGFQVRMPLGFYVSLPFASEDKRSIDL